MMIPARTIAADSRRPAAFRTMGALGELIMMTPGTSSIDDEVAEASTTTIAEETGRSEGETSLTARGDHGQGWGPRPGFGNRRVYYYTS